MNSLFLLQFGCFLFMLINAAFLGLSHYGVRCINPRYEGARWMIFTAFLGLAAQYLLQMVFGFRARGDDLGAIVNMLIYTPCVMLITRAAYHIAADNVKRRRLRILCWACYLTIWALFGVGYLQSGSLHIGYWLYAMLLCFSVSMISLACIVIPAMRRHRKVLEDMTTTDLHPYMGYMAASSIYICASALALPIVILSTQLLLIFGPLILITLLLFNLSFITLAFNNTPAEEQLAQEEDPTPRSPSAAPLSDERRLYISQQLDTWCRNGGYADSTVIMASLARQLNLPRAEMTLYFEQCLHSTFRSWLSNIRFQAAKQMVIEHPEYSNDFISAKCGFSSRSNLYLLFKEKEGCTPTEYAKRAQSGA